MTRALFCAALLGGAACARPAPPPAPAPPGPPPPPPVFPEALPCDLIEGIEVRKSERLLRVRCEGGGERSWRVALGREPVGPKRRIHDARTPEGVYLTAAPSRRSRFHLFLPIDYPSLADAEAGLAAGIISRRTRDAIARAHAEFRMPPQTTRLGGWLGFHGEGPRWQGDSQHLDWTYGCVAMSDAQIEFLAERAPVGTRVEIQP